MGEWFQEFFRQLKDMWQKLGNRAKIIIAVGASGVIIALITLIVWNSGTNYQALFNNLHPQDANAIVNKLEEKSISYKLDNNGTTIMVPQDEVYKLRIEMAGEGIPAQGVVGFEIFDQTKFGTTDFERKVNLYRALGGELSRSIQAMDAIEFARVQITAPRESLYIEEEQAAEGSVLLKLSAGYQLSRNQVNAISNLVASSVQGLSPDRVTIVDTAGNLLAAERGDTTFGSNSLSYSQFEIQQQFEEGLKSDLQAMLTKVLGPDNFAVQVHAKLNFDQREVESKTYSPVVDDNGIIRSKEEHAEKYQGDDGAAEGAPGTESNIPQYQVETDINENGNYEKTDIITNYEINEKIERHKYAPGSIEKISVAVMINREMNEEELQKIEESIKAAIAYNPERNDIVNVHNLNFDTSLEKEMAEAMKASDAADKRKMYIYAGLIAFILILLLIIFIVVRRSTISETVDYPNGQRVDMIVGDEETEKEIAISSEELSPEEKKRRKMKDELKELVGDQPKEIADILKGWLTEE